MFALFFSLSLAFFYGDFQWFDTNGALAYFGNSLMNVGTFISHLLTSFSPHTEAISNINDITDLYNSCASYVAGDFSYISLGIPSIVSGVIALVITIGIIVIALKAIKRLFTILFTLGR